MKRLILLLLVFSPLAAFAQGIRFDSIVIGPRGPIPNPTISVCQVSANGTPCTPLATTYTDATLTTPCTGGAQVTLTQTTTCVSSGDSNGNFGFWVAAGTYKYSVTGSGIVGQTYTLTLGSGSASTNSNFTMTQPTLATSGANQSSFSLCEQGNVWTGAVSAIDQWCWQDVLGSGSNPTSTLTLTHSGSTGASVTSIPALTVTGMLTPTSLDAVLYADRFCSGSTDIDVCVMNAINSASCLSVGNKQCKVVIPNPGAAGWNSHGTISIPFQNSGTFELEIQAGTVINELCTNNCDFIQFFATAATNNNNFAITGKGRIVGNSQAGNCLHFRQVSRGIIEDIECTGFTNKTSVTLGNGELNEGAVTMLNKNTLFDFNNIGIQNIGFAGGAGTTAPTVNIQTIAGRVIGNATGGVFENGSCTAACSFPNENNSYFTDIENNGNLTSSPTTTGSISCTLTTNVVVCTGAGTTTNITAGTIAVHSGFGAGIPDPCKNGRYAVQAATANTYTYNCTAANGTSAGGSVTGQRYQVFVENGNGINIYPTFMQWTNGASGFEAQIEIGDTNFTPTQTNIRNGFLSSVGSTSSIMLFGQSNTCIDGTFEFNSVTNFVQFGTSTQGPISIGACANKSNATNLTTGSLPTTTLIWDPVLGTFEVPAGSATNPGLAFSTDAQTGFFSGGTGILKVTRGGALNAAWQSDGFHTLTAIDVSFNGDSWVNRKGPNVIGIGKTNATSDAFIQSAMTARLITNDFTDANAAGLQVITGLSFALPNLAANWSFHCSIAYSQATPVAGDQFGVASLTTAPTNLKAQAHVITTEGATAVQTTGNSGNVSSTTPTSIVTFTPVGAGEKPVEIDGTVEAAGGGASTLQFYVTNGTAANVIVIKRGSYCTLTP